MVILFISVQHLTSTVKPPWMPFFIEPYFLSPETDVLLVTVFFTIKVVWTTLKSHRSHHHAPQEVGGTVIWEDGLTAMAVATYAGCYQIHHFHGFGAIPFTPFLTLL